MQISEQDIDGLPPLATHKDIVELVKDWAITDNMAYVTPAKSGGMYFFSFFPTIESPLVENVEELGDLRLVGVVHFFPEKMRVPKAGEGKYVFPPNLVGRVFSGFVPIDGVDIDLR